MSLQHIYQVTIHPENCFTERSMEDKLYYMTSMRIEEQISEDLAIALVAERRRNQIGFWPTSVSAMQKWIYQVADDSTHRSHEELMCILSSYDEDILAILAGDSSVQYEHTFLCIAKIGRLYSSEPL